METLPMGPAASQIAIKQLGTNGGGFFNANFAQARSASADPQSGDVRRVRRQHLHERAGHRRCDGTNRRRRQPGLHRIDRDMAVAHRAVRELRRSCRGKAQAATLRSMRRRAHAKRLVSTRRDEWKSCESAELARGDLVLVEARDLIPADGEIVAQQRSRRKGFHGSSAGACDRRPNAWRFAATSRRASSRRRSSCCQRDRARRSRQ